MSVLPAASPDLDGFVRRELSRLDGASVVIVVPAPAAPALGLLPAAPHEPFLFWRPPGGPSVSGIGEAWRIGLVGPGRFADLGRALGALWGGMRVVRHPAAPCYVPAVFGGFSFQPGSARAPEWSGYGDGTFVLPRWTYASGADGAVLALAASPRDAARAESLADQLRALLRALAGPGLPARPMPPHEVVGHMPREQWSRLVGDARDAIAGGVFEKVVLARRTRLAAATPFDVPAILARLGERQPDAFLFGFARGDSAFVGASPEPLVAKRGLAVRAEALAGTAALPPGTSVSDAAERAAALAVSPKDLAEHRPVVDAIHAELAPFCSRLTVSRGPLVRALPHVLHLSTPLEGELLPGANLPMIVGALHPTPALGGHPRTAALDWIAAHEPAARGWYGGPVGRIDMEGDGEFAVAIRSALVSGGEALVYAGAGIVSGSDPSAEFDETAAKQRTILAALAG